MASIRFWKGFAAGAAAGAGAGLGSWWLSCLVQRHEAPIVRLEKSLQIGRPVDEVFLAWSDFAKLPLLLPMVQEVQVHGTRSHWRMRLDGRLFEWDAKLTQKIPNQALGWKSTRGPKHTGRINFSPLGNDTEIHVVMNFAPPGGALPANITQATAALDNYLAQALRDFKAALEGKGQPTAEGLPEKRTPARVPVSDEVRATGTGGPEITL